MDPSRVLLLPGLGDSGPDHWQTLWQKRYGYGRVVQADWEKPDPADWLRRLTEAVAASPGPVVLVAHSLSCALSARFAGVAAAGSIAGALLVAPADVDSEMHTPDEVRGFSPMPMRRLPFSTIVVASRTDPYVRFARAEAFAAAWDARLADAGRVGHINTDSGLGEWPFGRALLDELLAAVATR